MSAGEFDRVDEAAAAVRARCGAAPDVAVVLGSGLGDFADSLADSVTVPYEALPHWPQSRVVGHAGRLVVGSLAGKRVAALAGRVHVYEGHPMATVVFAVRVMARLGVKRLILTNAAGGINTAFGQGALMVIDDHINLMGGNPLIGPNDDRVGPRFPDMSEVYSRRLRALADEAARAAGVPFSMASTSPSTARATRPRPRSAPSARSAPTPSACPRRPRRSRPGTWAWKCWASRASPTWPPACSTSRSSTTR